MLGVNVDSRPDAREIVESDRTYFELGALVEPLAAARLAWLPGLTHLPDGAVLDWLRPGARIEGKMLGIWESRFRALGATLSRLYFDEAAPADAELLKRSGYASRTEIAYSGVVAGEPRSSLRILSATSEGFWEAKLALHEASPETPSGHVATARDWVELERRKCATGEMHAYLAEDAGEIVGAFGTLRCDRLYRLKNIVVHPAWRRRNLASDILRWVSATAAADDRSGIGMLAVAGGAGDALYRKVRLAAAGSRIEWTKPL